MVTIKAFRSCCPSVPSFQANPQNTRAPGIFIFATKNGFTWGQFDVSEARPIDTGQAASHTRSTPSVSPRPFWRAFPTCFQHSAPHTHPARPWQSWQGEANRPGPHSGCSAHRDTLASKTMTLPPTPPGSCNGTSIRCLAGGGVCALPLDVAGLCLIPQWGGDAIRCPRLRHSLWVFLGPSCHAVRKSDDPVGRPERTRVLATGSAEVPLMVSIYYQTSEYRCFQKIPDSGRGSRPPGTEASHRCAQSKHLPCGSHEVGVVC